jgi:phosphoribosyl 1,2-cyclic phosphodiesterase
MKIQILGAHASESKTARCISILVDGALAIDAGALASSLSLAGQKRLRAILLTHAHFDHIKDIPLVALNLYRMSSSIRVHALPEVNASIVKHLLDGKVYPLLQELPVHRPTVTFHNVTPYRERKIAGYRVLPVPVNHDGNTVGYQIGDGTGKAFFYTADTGPGLAECWRRLSFQLLIIDTTFPNSYEKYARFTGHLTSRLLLAELEELRKIRGSLPRVVVVHRDPLLENKTTRELADVAAVLGIKITVAGEGKRLSL